MEITNLTGTTWVFGEKLLADWSKAFEYSVNFSCVIEAEYTGIFGLRSPIVGTGTVFKNTVDRGNYYFLGFSAEKNDNSIQILGHTYYGYNKASSIGNEYKTNFTGTYVTFTGGADVTNANLIAWLEANAVQQGGGDEDDPLYSIKKSTVTAIADKIRAKTGKTDLFDPVDMPTEIDGIETGITPTGTVNITENGTHDVSNYANAVVDVPNVIPDGYIKPSGTKEITKNGTHDVASYASVKVDVPSETVEEYDGSVTVSGGSDSGASLISFTIDGTEYQAVDGMTWADWIPSSYNTSGAYLDDSNSVSGNTRGILSKAGMQYSQKGYDKIIANQAYIWYMPGGGGSN